MRPLVASLALALGLSLGIVGGIALADHGGKPSHAWIAAHDHPVAPAGYHCWSELNAAMPDGLETICTSNTGQRLEEDQPGWDCHTMGNRVCGVKP